MNIHKIDKYEIIINEFNESLECMLVCSAISGRGGSHLSTTAFRFFDGFIKFSDNYIIFSVPAVSDKVLPFNHKALPFTCSSTD